MGSRLYQVTIEIGRLAAARWKTVCKDCTGAIDSVVELLQGRFARGVMERLCDQKAGLFPSPFEIGFPCTCPDWAAMCKHVAAVLYGIGARLDDSPDLFFALRQVDQNDLITQAPTALSLPAAVASPDRVLPSAGLSDIFGLDLGPAPAPPSRKPAKAKKAPARPRR
jgi:uncharacterized Zn finger protein